MRSYIKLSIHRKIALKLLLCNDSTFYDKYLLYEISKFLNTHYIHF